MLNLSFASKRDGLRFLVDCTVRGGGGEVRTGRGRRNEEQGGGKMVWELRATWLIDIHLVIVTVSI